MPLPIPTSRSRTLTASGHVSGRTTTVVLVTGSAAIDDAALRVQQQQRMARAQAAYFQGAVAGAGDGNGFLSATPDLLVTLQTQPGPPAQFRYVLTPRVLLVCGYTGSTFQFITGAAHTTPWYDQVGGAYPFSLTRGVGEAQADFTDEATAEEYLITVAGAPVEMRRDLSLTVDATSEQSWTYQYTGTFPAPAAVSVTLTANGTWTHAEANDPPYTSAGSNFTGIKRSCADYTTQLRCTGPAFPALPVSCTIAGLGLVFQPLDILVRKGDVRLAGTTQNAEYSWLGVSMPAPGVFGYPQSATALCSPAWALQVLGHDVDYRTGLATLAPQIDRYNGSVKVGTFTGEFRLPASGLQSGQQTTIQDGTGAAATGVFNTATSAMSSVLQPWTFEVNETWGDLYGCLLDSPQQMEDKKRYQVRTTRAVTAVTLTVAEEHEFGLFGTAAWWAAYMDADFLAANGRFSATPATVAAGSGLYVGSLQVTVADTDALVRTPLERFAPFMFRYLQLRFRSDGAGRTFRFWTGLSTKIGLGSATADFPWYGWEFTTEAVAAGEWQTVTFDLAHPRYFRRDDGGTDLAFHVDGNQQLRHPAEYFRHQDGRVGVQAWLEFLDTGEFWFDSVTGYHRPDELRHPGDDVDRIPAMALYPLEVMGDFGTTDDFPWRLPGTPQVYPSGSPWYVARLVTNGVRSADLICELPDFPEPPPNLWEFWDGVRLAYSATEGHDTGLSVEVSEDPLIPALQVLGYGAVEGPMGKILTPGEPLALTVRVRRPQLWGYPGAGDFDDYGPMLIHRLDRYWNGELLGNVHQGRRSRKGVQLALHDQPTGELRTVGVSDADGLYRLHYRYGATHAWSNVPRGGTIAQREQGQEGTAGGSDSFTTLGQRLNAWWLKGALDVETNADGFVHASGFYTGADSFPITERYPRWYDWGARPVSGGGVCYLATPWHELYLAYVEEGLVRVRRAPRGRPPFETDALAVATGTNSDPALAGAVDAPDTPRRLHLLFTREGVGVMECFSDDDGEHWSDPVSLFPGGVYPRSRVSPGHRALLRAAIVSGEIQGSLRWPSGAVETFVFQDAAGVDLAVEPESWDLEWVPEAEGRLQMIVRLAGDTEHTTLESASDGRRWSPVA